MLLLDVGNRSQSSSNLHSSYCKQVKMIGINVEGNLTELNDGYIQQLYGITTSIPFPKFTPAYAAPTKMDTGLACNLFLSRKRCRDLVTNPFSSPLDNSSHSGSFIFSQIEEQHEREIDRLMYQHAKKMKFEIAERIRNIESRGIIVAIEQVIMNKLKLKDDEISYILKHNSTLEDKVKSLFIENQLWRDLAQTNEEIANALRENLEQVLDQVRNESQNNFHGGDDDGDGDGEGVLEDFDLIDDAESFCGSNSDEEEIGVDRLCRSCGREEAAILLLPCRHLCLCRICGSSVYTCPVCECNTTSSVHLNLQKWTTCTDRSSTK